MNDGTKSRVDAAPVRGWRPTFAQVSTTTGPASYQVLGDPLRGIFGARLWRAVLFLALNCPLGVIWLCVLLTLMALSISTMVIWIGVGIFALSMHLWIAGAQFDRWRIAVLLGANVTSPYRPLPLGSMFRQVWARARDEAVWRDLLYLLLLFPVGTLEISIVGSALVAPLGLIAASVHLLVTPELFNTTFFYLTIGSVPQAAFFAVIGVLWLLAGQYIVVGVARGHIAFAQALLGPSRQRRLEARVTAISESRSRVIDTALVDRQRIERDLHDGAQQRLVALAMDLGIAREKLVTDPVAARELVTKAHEEAKSTLVEIRDLVRGIYPSVLADRGLDPAISALAGRCPVPVTVMVELAERVPAAVESTAYFLIAEALTNVAKHSHASEAWVVVRLEEDRLTVEVRDNGVGGADSTVGTGLVGLASRVAAIDGQFVVTSPPCGPTRVYAELPLPCES